jgi:Holliday junction DNA helicase RuvA
MIASVRGEVLEIALDHVVLEAAGVGYKVMATPSTLATLRRGAEARLIIAMIVREDSMTLYGFVDGDARDLFSTLLGVSGVGPKIALSTLAVYDATALRQALADPRRVIEGTLGLSEFARRGGLAWAAITGRW